MSSSQENSIKLSFSNLSRPMYTVYPSGGKNVYSIAQNDCATITRGQWSIDLFDLPPVRGFLTWVLKIKTIEFEQRAVTKNCGSEGKEVSGEIISIQCNTKKSTSIYIHPLDRCGSEGRENSAYMKLCKYVDPRSTIVTLLLLSNRQNAILIKHRFDRRTEEKVPHVLRVFLMATRAATWSTPVRQCSDCARATW